MFIIFPIILFFINTAEFPQTGTGFSINHSSNDLSIFLIKQRWHTGIILKRANIDTSIFPEVKNLPNTEFLDIGWGDKKFYLHPGFDYELAFKALFYPTPSALRIEAVDSINKYIKYSDITTEIKISKNSFDNLCEYIAKAFYKNYNNKSILITERNNGRIKYYEANGSYLFLNTCNTWIAKGLQKAGFIISNNIIITEQIFKEMQKYGKIIKSQ